MAPPQMSLKYLVQFPALKRPSNGCCVPRNKIQRNYTTIPLQTQAKVNHQCPSTASYLEEYINCHRNALAPKSICTFPIIHYQYNHSNMQHRHYQIHIYHKQPTCFISMPNTFNSMRF